MPERPFLFDATRLISRSWTRRLSTGIDRVCYAYLDRFASLSHAVVQHRGMFRILTAGHSERLFEILRGPDAHFRHRLALLAPGAIAEGRTGTDTGGAVYLNVSHTDFDLADHARWAERCRLRPVYLIHDLIPVTHPELCRPHAVVRHRGRVTGALRTAAGIVVNSRATAADLERFAMRERLPLPPVLAAPLGLAALAGSPPATAPQPYFVCVGTIEPRKNHAMLLQVWRQLIRRTGDRTPRLVLIGQWGVNADHVRAMLHGDAVLREHVTMLTRCPDAELGGWIAGARALLMPTLAEGFGLPVAEALALSTPVIASDLPCFREIGQGVPVLLDPHDVAAWERAIGSFDRAGSEAARQCAAMRRYQPMTWDSHFADVESWLETLPASADSRQAARPAMPRRVVERPFAERPALGVAGD